MPDIDINTPTQEVKEYASSVEDKMQNSVSETIDEYDSDSQNSVTYDGYNDITVSIKDKDTPIVILFGPKSCGKTMTLVRLSRYLKEQMYTVSPDRTFRDSGDKHYERMCREFPNMINSDDAASSTNLISFMLASITRNGKKICQILEAPGELYFDEDNPKKDYPTYINQIKNLSNRKIWIFMLEPDWKNEQDRQNYVDRITDFAKNIRSKDSVILLMNKIDKSNLVIKVGVVNTSALFKEVKDSYPGILEPFVNKIPILNWFEKYRCRIIPFQTGDYTVTDSGKMKYQKSDDIYPMMLWRAIRKIVRG
ncbi:MAG: hypothetical protein J6P44_07475 [Bacteroidales bacterium]|nr:hypothetical protein [Bacteroidales bacterium]